MKSVERVAFDSEYHIRVLQAAIHKSSIEMGWYHDPVSGAPKDRCDAEKLLLIHSEVSEAAEGVRKDLMDDHLPDRKMVEVELADAVIRILDYAGYRDLDIAGAITEKLAYNKTRADHKLENRQKAGGKLF